MEIVVNVLCGEALQVTLAVNNLLNGIVDVVELPQGIGPLCKLQSAPSFLWVEVLSE